MFAADTDNGLWGSVRDIARIGVVQGTTVGGYRKPRMSDNGWKGSEVITYSQYEDAAGFGPRPGKDETGRGSLVDGTRIATDARVFTPAKTRRVEDADSAADSEDKREAARLAAMRDMGLMAAMGTVHSEV